MALIYTCIYITSFHHQLTNQTAAHITSCGHLASYPGAVGRWHQGMRLTYPSWSHNVLSPCKCLLNSNNLGLVFLKTRNTKSHASDNRVAVGYRLGSKRVPRLSNNLWTKLTFHRTHKIFDSFIHVDSSCWNGSQSSCRKNIIMVLLIMLTTTQT